MKKLNSQGFILAETLVVSVFLMVLFTMIYSNFFPLIGEYEKRENYDDVDGKYVAYWVKKMIESGAYTMDSKDYTTMNKWGYVRFECDNVSADNNQQEMCINLVNSIEIANCDGHGNGCDAFITRYTIGGMSGPTAAPDFKDLIRSNNIKRWNEVCPDLPLNGTAAATASDTSCASVAFQECCKQKGLTSCTRPVLTGTPVYSSLYTESATEARSTIAEYCNKRLTQKSFNSATKDYILTLPNYTIAHSKTGANYRVIVIVHHKKDNNDYYSFSTMEVIR